MKSIALELPVEDRAKVFGAIPVNPVLVLLALGFFLLLCLAPPAAAQGGRDLPVLRGGERIGSRVLPKSEEQIVHRAGMWTHKAGAPEVAEARSVERSLRDYLERFAAVDQDDVQAVYELGFLAEAHQLPGEARNAWLRVLTLAPRHQGAWIKLGGVKRNGDWKLKLRGRFWSLDDLRARAGESPLELDTAHFRIRFEGSLERALDAAVELERRWLAFHDLVAEPLDLLVQNRTLGRRGEIEPRARKGLACVFAGAARPAPGEPLTARGGGAALRPTGRPPSGARTVNMRVAWPTGPQL